MNEQKHGGAMQESFRASVRPLEWSWDKHNRTWEAYGIQLMYQITGSVRKGFNPWILRHSEGDWWKQSFLGLQPKPAEAKAACQADHDKRVRALLNIEEPSK